MGKTFANLRDSLASAIGFAYVDLDTQDQRDLDTIINAAYLDCYAAKDGRRPRWATRYISEIIKAPASATLSVTNGSTTISGFSFEAKYIGSFVRVGDKFFRLASTTSFVQPWDGDTGSVAATVYYNAVALSGLVVKVREMPSLLGVGPLLPMPFTEDEVELRSTPSGTSMPGSTW